MPAVAGRAGFAAANDLVGKPDADVREVMGNKFPKHIYHTIVCIGALVAHRESDCWAVDALGAPHVGERTEKQLISAFCEKIADLTPQLVTFNGNTFDLPVLRYRAMIHGVSAPGLAVRPYFNRYTERRQLLWFAVTQHPTAEWLAQQIVEAFPWSSSALQRHPISPRCSPIPR